MYIAILYNKIPFFYIAWSNINWSPKRILPFTVNLCVNMLINKTNADNCEKSLFSKWKASFELSKNQLIKIRLNMYDTTQNGFEHVTVRFELPPKLDPSSLARNWVTYRNLFFLISSQFAPSFLHFQLAVVNTLLFNMSGGSPRFSVYGEPRALFSPSCFLLLQICFLDILSP